MYFYIYILKKNINNKNDVMNKNNYGFLSEWQLTFNNDWRQLIEEPALELCNKIIMLHKYDKKK